MTTAAPSTALVTIQPAFTDAERLALQCRNPSPFEHQASKHSTPWLSLAGDRKRPQDLG
jgi:hypothetical protein